MTVGEDNEDDVSPEQQIKLNSPLVLQEQGGVPDVTHSDGARRSVHFHQALQEKVNVPQGLTHPGAWTSHSC